MIKTDIAIIGAGPGGLAAAANAAHHKISHILFEKSEIANTIYQYQLGKHVMAEPGNLPLRAQLSFEAGTREEILENWKALVEKFKINLLREEILEINKSNEGFLIKSNKSQVLAKSVVLGIGVQGTPRKLGVKGEESSHVAYTLRDPAAFNDLDILVVGAGDAAIENAIALSAKNRVVILNRTGEFPRAKDANAAAILAAINSGKIKCYYNSETQQIKEKSVVLLTPEGEVEIPCNHIIARLGAIPPRAFLENIGISFPSKDPSALPVVNEKYETNVSGLYAVGALIGYPLIKQAINQGYEVIEHILGNKVEPADQPIIIEKLANLNSNLGVTQTLNEIQEKLSLFKSLSVPQFRELITESKIHLFKKEEIVFEENDYSDTFFSVIEGSVSIELAGGRRVELSEGSFFGEMSLFSGRRRSATVKAKAGTLLLETQRRQILKLIRSEPELSRVIDKLFVTRALETKVFPGAKHDSIESILPKLTYKKFKKGEVIFNQGDLGDALYIIRKGSVQISRKNSKGIDIPQTYLSAGNFFGEMALISEQQQERSASVKAAVNCETLVLLRDDVIDLLKKDEEVTGVIRRTAEMRAVANALDVQDTTHGALLGFMIQQGITDADNVLIIDSDLCVGCDNCEKACAATHEGHSRLDRKGGKSYASIQIPISCRHCENPLCMLDCPPDALERKENGEVIIKNSCIGCENCVRNCPYGVITMIHKEPSALQKIKILLGWAKEDETKKAAKCDMCSELMQGPACIRACPTGAAMRINPKSILEMLDE